MARDDKKNSGTKKPGQQDSASPKRVIGEGMNSLDSTQAPLKASTGEPDYDAMKDKGKNLKPKSGKSSKP